MLNTSNRRIIREPGSNRDNSRFVNGRIDVKFSLYMEVIVSNQPKLLMTKFELSEFMLQHHLGEKDLAALVGVTPQAVRLWVTEKNPINQTTIRLIRLFKKYPSLIKEF